MLCSIRVRFWYCVLGIVIGVTALPAFIFGLRNFNASAFCFIQLCYVCASTWLHWQYKKGRITTAWIPKLRVIMLTGCFGQLAGALALVSYISVAAVLNQNLSEVKGENYYIASVWGWMTWKWSFYLFWWARIYRREMQAQLTGLNNGHPEGKLEYGAIDD